MENFEANISETEKDGTKKLFKYRFISILALVICLILVVSSILITKYLLTVLRSSGQKAQSTEFKTDKNSIQNVKKAFLNSKSLNNIITGAALGFIPENEINPELGSVAYNFQFYGLELNEEQHTKFIKFAYPHTSFSGSFPTMNEAAVWLAAMPSDSEILLTKNGFLCKTPPDYGPTLCADDGSGECIYPDFKGIKCAYIKDPKGNSLEKVSVFLQGSLNDAEINCNGQCAIKDLGDENIVISSYSRRIVYFEDSKSLDKDENIKIVTQEVKKSVNYFMEADWNVSENDITEIEKGWDQNVYSSVQISATNNQFNCEHTITTSTSWSKIGSQSARKRDIIECSIHPSILGQVSY